MGDQHEGALEGGEGRLELLDGLEVEVVGGLVEHQAVDAAGHEQGQERAAALARREVPTGPVRRAPRRARTWPAASGPRSRHAGLRLERGEQPLVAREAAPAAGRAAPTWTPGPNQRLPAGERKRRRAAPAAGSTCRCRWRPRMASRSCQPISRSIGPSRKPSPTLARTIAPVEAGHHVAAAGRRGQLICRRHPSHGLSTASSRAIWPAR